MTDREMIEQLAERVAELEAVLYEEKRWVGGNQPMPAIVKDACEKVEDYIYACLCGDAHEVVYVRDIHGDVERFQDHCAKGLPVAWKTPSNIELRFFLEEIKKTGTFGRVGISDYQNDKAWFYIVGEKTITEKEMDKVVKTCKKLLKPKSSVLLASNGLLFREIRTDQKFHLIRAALRKNGLTDTEDVKEFANNHMSSILEAVSADGKGVAVQHIRGQLKHGIVFFDDSGDIF